MSICSRNLGTLLADYSVRSTYNSSNSSYLSIFSLSLSKKDTSANRCHCRELRLDINITITQTHFRFAGYLPEYKEKRQCTNHEIRENERWHVPATRKKHIISSDKGHSKGTD